MTLTPSSTMSGCPVGQLLVDLPHVAVGTHAIDITECVAAIQLHRSTHLSSIVGPHRFHRGVDRGRDHSRICHARVHHHIGRFYTNYNRCHCFAGLPAMDSRKGYSYGRIDVAISPSGPRELSQQKAQEQEVEAWRRRGGSKCRQFKEGRSDNFPPFFRRRGSDWDWGHQPHINASGQQDPSLLGVLPIESSVGDC